MSAISWLIVGLFLGSSQMEDDVIVISREWTCSVFCDGIERVDNLVFDEAGVLYVSQEIGDRKGAVLSIRDGQLTPLLRGLDKSDGLAINGRMLFIAEEVENGRIIQFDLETHEQKTLTRLNRPEGIDLLPSGDLIVVEDDFHGRLIRLSLHGEVEVLARDFNRLEGVSVGGGGRIYMSETETGRVYTFCSDSLSLLLENLNNPDQMVWGPDNALWISEDTCPGRILRYVNGTVTVFAEGLCAPQGITFDQTGKVYVADQDRNRILVFQKHPNTLK